MTTTGSTTALVEQLESLVSRFPGRVGYSIEDVQNGLRVAHDEQVLFPTASVIKLPLLSAFSAYVDHGGASWDEQATITDQDVAGGSGLLQHLTLPRELSYGDAAWYALCLSDNVATNLFITRMGGVEEANRILQQHVGDGLHLLSRAMVRKDASARSMGEATPAGLGDFLRRLAAGRVPGAHRLLDITEHQVYRNMIPRYLPLPGTAFGVQRICNKTGFLPGIRGDAAVIETRTGSMVMVAFTDRASPSDIGEDPGEQLIAALAARAFEVWFATPQGPDGHEESPTP